MYSNQITSVLNEEVLSLRLCTFNCRSMKNSILDIRNLCNKFDVIFLQEHWLLPFELSELSGIDHNFLSFGMSAVNIGNGVLRGRPYGGTAILYKKHLSEVIDVVASDESRMCVINVKTRLGPVLFINVYMPCDTDDYTYNDYVDMYAKVSSVFADSESVYLVVAGDFNCRSGTRAYSVFQDFLEHEHLVCVDHLKLNDVVTYISDDGQNMSWIDHIVCSQALLTYVNEVNVLFDHVCSDHKPMSARFNLLASCASTHSPPCHRDGMGVFTKSQFCNWSGATNVDICNYRAALSSLIKKVNIPSHIMTCNGICNDSSHYNVITDYYGDIINCVHDAALMTIPVLKSNSNQYNIPGWSDYVRDKYDISRQAFLDWVADGKPRCGFSYQNMYKTRSVFKHALRFCRRHEEQLKADACAKSYEDSDPRRFWKTVSNVSSNKASKHVNKIGNCTGSENICTMWYDHFNWLYNSVPDGGAKAAFENLCSSLTDQPVYDPVTVKDIIDAISIQKKSRSAGPNKVTMESFIYGSVELFIHLSLFYTVCLRHSFLPDRFMDVIVTPVVKNKGGDLTDVNNYRAIAVSNADTKILERIILSKVETSDSSVSYQFGFKKNHSTSLCAGSVKKVINYYITRGSHIFVTFVDFTKAFDRVNYWKLFKQLIDDGIHVSVVRLLAFWYVNQGISVCWNNTKSSVFTVGNGTKQGGVLSPYLFTRYIRPLLFAIYASNCGCKIGNVSVNVFAYADDIALLAPSWRAMQTLIDSMVTCCVSLDLMCNVMKTVCMVFSPTDRTMIVSHCFPSFVLCGKPLKFVNEFRYLGHILMNNSRDDRDIQREMRNMFIRTNMLIRRFSRCSAKVKLRLFTSYCLCLYGVGLWSDYAASTLLKFKYCYHKCIKMFFGYTRSHSISSILLDLKLPSFNTLVHNCRYRFHMQLSSSTNVVVSNIWLVCNNLLCF